MKVTIVPGSTKRIKVSLLEVKLELDDSRKFIKSFSQEEAERFAANLLAGEVEIDLDGFTECQES